MNIKDIINIVFPSKFVRALLNIKHNYFDEYALKSYSQEGEDIILRHLFKNKNRGFYVDVGAHHPKRYSNTYFFYKRGWRGINIDAMPGSMRLFKKLRPRDINIERAVSDKKSFLTYYCFNEPGLNSFSKELSYKLNGVDNYRIISEQILETFTLREILDNYLPAGQVIDFLSVDVEGLDMDVLLSNDWDKYKPKVILAEQIETTMDKLLQSELYSFLLSNNYILFAKMFNTIIFILNK